MVQLLVVGGKSLEDGEAARGVWFREELGYVSVAVRHFKELFVTKRKALSSFLVFLITCTCAVQLSPSAILWYNDAFAVLVVIGLSLYYFFLPFM